VTYADPILYPLAKHRTRIAALTIAAGAAAYAFAAPSYTATARLFAGPAQTHGEAARNEAEILRDPALLRALLPQLKPSLPARLGQLNWWQLAAVTLGLARPETPENIATARLARALTVLAVPETDVVALHFSWTNPNFAAAVLNALLREQQILASGSAQASQTVMLAQTRLHDAQNQLDRINAEIAALPPVAGGTADPGAIEREKDRVASRIAATSSAADALRVDRELVARKMDAAEKAFAGGGWVDNADAPVSTSGAPVLDQAFVDLLDKRGRILSHAQPDEDKLRRVDQEISAAREKAFQNVKQVLGDRLRTMDERLAALAAQNADDQGALRSLDDHLVQLEAFIGSRQASEARVTEATRQLGEQERQAETAIREAAGLRVLSEASLPADPDFPSPLLVIGGACLGGFALGLISALLSERRRITIDRPQDIARVLKIPVLASVPELR